jgi:hypothetical protein
MRTALPEKNALVTSIAVSYGSGSLPSVNSGININHIVGVAPPGFFGFTVGRSPDLWVPVLMGREIAPDWAGLDGNRIQTLHIIARRKAGVDLDQAEANTNLLFKQILLENAGTAATPELLEDIERARITLTPAATGRSRLRLHFSPALKVLMALVALVLLIACGNVANLPLARANIRRREIAIRMSVGRLRTRLIRQMLLESGLLAFAASAVGMTIAWASSRLLLTMVSTGGQPLPISTAPDAAVLAFTLGVTILTVIVFGTDPAFYATGFDPASWLREGRGAGSAPKIWNPHGPWRRSRTSLVDRVTRNIVARDDRHHDRTLDCSRVGPPGAESVIRPPAR